MPKNYIVSAPDLQGIGDSSKPLTGYDGKTLAEDRAFVVFPYAAAHPTEVKGLVVMEIPPPGFFPPPSVKEDLHYGGSYSIKHQTYQKPLCKVKG